MIDEILEKYKVCCLVGTNSQGKTTILSKFNKEKGEKSLFLSNEVKANEYIKNSASNSPLVQWLVRLLNIEDIQNKINEQLETIKLDDINELSNVDVTLRSSTEDYKGLVNVEITTSSNQWEKPGSGETFLAELLLVKKMLHPGINNPIKYLIIDEPETFLHPSLFLKVANILKDICKYTSIVIATHSPIFLEYMADDLGSVVYVKNGKLKKIPCDSDAVEMFKNHPFYKRVLEYTASELKTKKSSFNDLRKESNCFKDYYSIFIKPKIIQSLFSKTILVGEGRTEKIVFDCFKKEKSRKLELSDVEFIDIYGKDFMPYFAYFMEQIGLDVIIMYDLDSNHSDECNLKLNSELKKFSNINFEYDIETYLGLSTERKDKTTFSPILIYQMYFEREENLIDLINNIECKIMSCIN